MNKDNLVRRVIDELGGIVKTAQLNQVGVANYELSEMCKRNFLTRIRHGYYQLSEQDTASEEQLIARFLPEGIICMDSALFFYGYSDRTPHKWTIAVPRNMTAAKLKIDFFPNRLFFIQQKYLKLGMTTGDFNGTKLPIYDRERTICDCFKYRTKMDSEMFNKAINAYVADDEKNLSNLSRYAREMKLFQRINNLMGVLLNG